MGKITAGLLLYRRSRNQIEVFLVHPGGPFWQNKDDGAWSIPKGEVREGEDLLEAAKREFKEETDFKPEGEFVYIGQAKSGNKTVHAWALEGDADPGKLKSNSTFIEWPPKSGKKLEIPEVDKGAFFALREAEKKILSYQQPLLKELERVIIEAK